jgi:hypothetical protein
MRLLGSALKDALQKAGASKRLEERGCLELWSAVVGEEVARATVPEFVRDGVMYVRARSSVWAYELTFFREGFIQELNSQMGRALVKEIRFRVGPVPDPEEPVKKQESKDDLQDEIKLDPEQAARVEAMAGSVRDSSLRARVHTLLLREQVRRIKRLQEGLRTCPSCGVLHQNATPKCPVCDRGKS